MYVLAGVVLFGSAVVGYATYLKHSAQHLRDDVAALAMKGGSFDDAHQLAARYREFRVPAYISAWSKGRQLVIRQDDPCTAKQCAITIRIETTALARLHIISWSKLTATILVVDNQVAVIDLTLQGGQHRNSGGYVRYVGCCTSVSELFRVNSSSSAYSFPTPIGKPYLMVQLTNQATPQQKQRAFDLNMSCLLSRSGCDWPCDYLPLAWKDYEKEVHIDADQVLYWKKEGMDCS